VPARAVIVDAEADSAVVEVRRDLQPACGGIDADAVLDGILNQWLKRQTRHIDCEKFGWHVHVNFQAIMKACLFDLQILADELELALQGDLVLRRSRAMRSKSPRLTSRWLAASTSSCIRTPMV